MVPYHCHYPTTAGQGDRPCCSRTSNSLFHTYPSGFGCLIMNYDVSIGMKSLCDTSSGKRKILEIIVKWIQSNAAEIRNNKFDWNYGRVVNVELSRVVNVELTRMWSMSVKLYRVVNVELTRVKLYGFWLSVVGFDLDLIENRSSWWLCGLCFLVNISNRL
jgi:hypothetical protein